ncbi:hypothetical protein MUY21_08935 [Aliiroseovarius sp. S2029]|uniref:hypothetical protein n=1 Tax=Aliiroseovarius sp. S2029 TaxID=2936988 RepID=UPI0020BE7224|nr:hypothetical protein [Aliiroseovarius sp. S2029]MCK8484161.1 hypothetical protein [Aliiroseovarius sp. S2029]
MLKDVFVVAATSFVALPALAQTCAFTMECYETEACQDTSFALTAELDDSKLVTDFGDLTVVGVKRDAPLITVFATGEGAEYLLSRNGDTARFTAHSNDGPTAITYLGTCEGEF